MNEVEKVKNGFINIIAIYIEAEIIEKVQYSYSLDAKDNLQEFRLYITPKNENAMQEFFKADDFNLSYAESLEGALISASLLFSKSISSKIKVMVNGSGNSRFNLDNLKILEV